MSKIEEKLKELENKIEGLSKQLGRTQELMAQLIEERRKEAEKKLEKRELSLYYRGLAMGLILGVVGNLFVHFLMNALEILKIPAYDWVLVTTGAFAITLTLIWLFDRESKKLLKEST